VDCVLPNIPGGTQYSTIVTQRAFRTNLVLLTKSRSARVLALGAMTSQKGDQKDF
jgi:hypothetical protein